MVDDVAAQFLRCRVNGRRPDVVDACVVCYFEGTAVGFVLRLGRLGRPHVDPVQRQSVIRMVGTDGRLRHLYQTDI